MALIVKKKGGGGGNEIQIGFDKNYILHWDVNQ